MFEEPCPKRFGPLCAACVAWMNRIWLARNRASDRVGIEDETRFGALFDDFDDACVLAPKRRRDPDARRVSDDFDKPRHSIGTSPRIGEGDFVCTQSNDHEVGVIVTNEAR